jgi:ferredoxin-NADP reductase
MRRVRVALAGAPFHYIAGQAVMLGVAGQPGSVPYSIASAPDESRERDWLEFLVKVEPSGRWGNRFDRLVRGLTLSVRGPYGTFVLPETTRDRHFLFIAGGSGIAPLRAMIRQLIARRYTGSMRLLYSARTPADFAYLPELRALVRDGSLEVTLTATREVGPRWRGERGRIVAERLASLVDEPRTLCYVCGPTSMVRDVPLVLRHLGVQRPRIHVEQW